MLQVPFGHFFSLHFFVCVFFSAVCMLSEQNNQITPSIKMYPKYSDNALFKPRYSILYILKRYNRKKQLTHTNTRGARVFRRFSLNQA